MNINEKYRKDFIRSICANPFDISERLIYADWLEEQGELEQSEFIRRLDKISKKFPPSAFLERDKQVIEILKSKYGAFTYCLGTTKDGHPKHPLYIKSETKPDKIFKLV